MHEGFIASMANTVREGLEQFDAAGRDQVLLLFSAHSLPLDVIDRGDAYPQEIGASVQAVVERLGRPNPYILAYQSEVGPVRWLGPSTEWVIKRLGQRGQKDLLVVPIAFTYVRTRTRAKYDHSLVQTVIVLPIVVTAILVVVRDSLALAFSLAGIVAAVRFRNNLKESGDAVYIFGAIGIGFASGIHALSVAAVLSMVFVVVELSLWKFDFSADFERTFARLCLPSGADLPGLPEPNGVPRAAPPAAPAVPPVGDGKPATRLRIYVDRTDAARPLIETVLERDTKRWSFEAEEPAAERGAPVLAYRVRPRKSVGLEGLRSNLLREGAPYVVAADDAPEL